MSSTGSGSSIADLAGPVLGRRAVRRLEKVLHPGSELTFEHLVHAVDPPSPEDLAAVLSLLVEHGDLQQYVRVESPTHHGGLGDFPSLREVPSEIFDWRADQEIAVQPENLRVVYAMP
jgi:hypothetical protein